MLRNPSNPKQDAGSKAEQDAGSKAEQGAGSKAEQGAGSNIEKDPADWVSGDDPMTGAQASYLKTLSEEARDPQAFSENLTKAEASQRIDALKAKIGLQPEPPHTQ